MTPASAAGTVQGAVRQAPSLDGYLTAIRNSNPFNSHRVSEPSAYDVDVDSIHATAFDQLTGLADLARRDRQGIGAVLLADPGIGKSHLLSRVFRWASRKDENGQLRACYVSLHNLLVDPDRLPRYLLKCVVNRLAAPGPGPLSETPLYRPVVRATAHASGVSEYTLKSGWDAFRTRFADSAPYPEIYQVLYQFLRHARPEKASDPGRRHLASQAVAWLEGEEIDPEPAHSLGLRTEGQSSARLRNNQEVEQVLLILARLAQAAGQPFVLCIDQVDNFDHGTLKALARFIHALIDHAENLLVITSGIKSKLLGFVQNDVIPDSSWDRLAQYKVDLHRIRAADARRILEARLERFHEPFMPVDAVRGRVQEDTLFPLGRAWLDQQLADGVEFSPRKVLIWARDAWDAERSRLASLGGGRWIAEWPNPGVKVIEPGLRDVTTAELEAEIDVAVARKIEEQVAQRRLQPGGLPPDAGNLVGLVETLLGQCGGDGLPYTFRGQERRTRQGGVLPPYDLLVRERRESDGREVTTGVLPVTNIGQSATASLRRLLEGRHTPDHRILVTDQERRPLKVGAQGVEYYRDLEKLGRGKFEHVKLNFEQYAALDALAGVAAMARAGDLEIEVPRGTIRPVTEAEVVASHHRQDRYRAHPLLHPLLTEEPIIIPPPGDGAKVDEKDVRQYIMAQLAWMMGTTASALAKGYVGIMPAPALTPEAAWCCVKVIAEKMHAEGLVHAQPLDDDLFLLLRK